MTQDPDSGTFAAPSPRLLMKTSLLAVAAAVLALVLFVLPAEYGIDYTGFGRLVGLTTLAETEEAAGEDASPSASPSAAGADADLPWEEGGPPPLEGIGDYARAHDNVHSTTTLEIHLNPGEEVEFKAQMEKGEPLLYSWAIAAGDIYFDFHGEPTEGEWPEGFFMSYGEGEAGRRNGSFVAPFTGRHGWYWLNYNEEPVTVTLTFEGYYDSFGEVYRASQY